jgi:hypothetical protein
MKNSNQRLAALALLVIMASTVRAGIVTLTAGGTNSNPTAVVKAGEIAQIRFTFDSSGIPGNAFLTIAKDGINFTFGGDRLSPSYAVYRGNPVIAGPATISLVPGSGATAFVTIEIAPESFPPDKTIIIPEGTGAKIALECSTNLLTWSEVWTNSYTNVPSHKFFRIKAERIP